MQAKRLFPVLEWLPRYSRGDLTGDLAAGVTVGAMLIPQGMAYALLAGLPPQVGLYASMLPLVVYALLGRSRQLGFGPTAISSLLVAAGLAPLAAGNTDRYVELAAALAVMVGVLRIALGTARLGFVVNFLSGPVLVGFTAAAAVVIGLSQAKHLLGVPLTDSSEAGEVLADIFRRLDEVSGGTVAVGAAALAVLIVLQRFRPGWPAALIVVAIGALVSSIGGFEEHGISVVGDVPRSLPTPSRPSVSADNMRELLPSAVAITILGFIESIAIAKVFARRYGYSIRANQELVATGAATVAAGVMGGYPVSGSFSRTAVNARAGARTPASGVFAALVVLIATVAGASAFRWLPNAVLAAIVIAAVIGLVEVREAVRLWKVKRSDFWTGMLAFVATLTLGVELGLGLAVIASLALIVQQVTRPHTAVLGRLPNSDVFRNVERFPAAEKVEGLAVLRFDAPLYFANVEFFRGRLRKLETGTGGALKAVVLDATAINDIDATGEAALAEVAQDYADRGIAFYISQAKGPVIYVLRRSGLFEQLGQHRFPYTNDEAVRRAEAEIAGHGEATATGTVPG